MQFFVLQPGRLGLLYRAPVPLPQLLYTRWDQLNCSTLCGLAAAALVGWMGRTCGCLTHLMIGVLLLPAVHGTRKSMPHAAAFHYFFPSINLSFSSVYII